MLTPENIAPLRELFRKYKRLASRLRDGMGDLGSAASFHFNMRFEEDKGTSASFDENAPMIRFAALLRPFMDSSSSVEMSTVWNVLIAEERLVDPETVATMQRNFETVERLGGIAVVLNGKHLKARDLYFAYADGTFFDEKPEAKELLSALSFGSMAQMMPFLFYSACADYAKLVFVILDVILSIERINPDFASFLAPEQRCIYCLKTEGDFSSEEHVLPEAFGFDEMVLTNGTCKKCNNELSRLDQYLSEFGPLALLRVQFVPLTKKGKFPRAETSAFIVEKTKPRLIVFTSKTGKRIFAEEALPDGKVKLSSNYTSGKAVDMRQVSRAVFKIGLGIVAYDAGIAYACSPNFDAARAFIQGEGNVPNHLLMTTHVQQPTPMFGAYWHPEIRTIVCIDIFGIRFAVNLEPLPLSIPVEAPPESLQAFWLGGGHRKNGVIPPCRTSNCPHSSINASA